MKTKRTSCPAVIPLTPVLTDAVLAAVCRLGHAELPTIYAAVVAYFPGLTLGAFHDTLRQLHTEGRIRLTPWTGALAAILTPGNAIFWHGQVLYFAEPTRRPAA
jgi:hypothetical protein